MEWLFLLLTLTGIDVKTFFVFILVICLFNNIMLAQSIEDDSDFYEVFLIDSFVTPEVPHTFVLSFFTPEEVLSRVIIADKYEIPVSVTATEDHKIRINLSPYKFDSLYVKYKLVVTDVDGNDFESQTFELALSSTFDITMDGAPGLLTTCCFGGVVFGLPSPNLIFTKEKSLFSLTKEIPILTYYSHGYNYPDLYLSLEYSYIFEGSSQHIGRLGLKKIFLLEPIEYIAPGITFFGDFKGTNGLGPELTVGWFKVSTVFTFYSRYRYNHAFNDSNNSFHEISLGLYSSFFSINL
ncbi:MAG: hypothetical protein KKA84_08920 [Bacteroidetes bacterium]|nr:hypothetical protein [Bacteroidota bacterium]